MTRNELEERVHRTLTNKDGQSEDSNLVCCDLLLNIFYTSLKSYKRSTLCTPFPSHFRKHDDGHLENMYSEVEHSLLQIPPLNELTKDKISQLPLESLILLDWIIHPKDFSVHEISHQQFLNELPRYDKGKVILSEDHTRPMYIFEIKYSNSTPFERLREKQGSHLLYGFHGSPLENWHSILHNKLNGKFSKDTSLFGLGIYLSFDQKVAENFLAFGSPKITFFLFIWTKENWLYSRMRSGQR